MTLLRRPFMRSGKEMFGIDRYDPSLALYLPLWYEGLQGSPIVSLDNNRYSCTVTGATWGSQGRTFDGVDDEINAGNPTNLNITSQITVACWIKPAVSGNSVYRTFMVKRLGADANYQLYLNNAAGANAGILQFYAGSNNNSTYVPTMNVWILVTATVLAGASLIYVNASQVFSGSNTLATNTGNFYIGRPAVIGGADQAFSGIVGEAWIYGRALSAQEVQQIYLATKWRYV